MPRPMSLIIKEYTFLLTYYLNGWTGIVGEGKAAVNCIGNELGLCVLSSKLSYSMIRVNKCDTSESPTLFPCKISRNSPLDVSIEMAGSWALPAFLSWGRQGHEEQIEAYSMGMVLIKIKKLTGGKGTGGSWPPLPIYAHGLDEWMGTVDE